MQNPINIYLKDDFSDNAGKPCGSSFQNIHQTASLNDVHCMICGSDVFGSFLEIQTTITELQICDIRVHGQLKSERGEKYLI